ncbi:MAG: pyruvate dehydrogenase complex E1 component subunit beta, partial [Hyphomicrobiales bacterium]
AGPHHSGAYHPIWAHVPGLVVAVPSNPADAKGLMKTALRACDPVAGTYRTQAEIDAWANRDPIKSFRELLIDASISSSELDAIDAVIEKQVGEALAFAREAPEPDPATVHQFVFADPLNPPEALAGPRSAKRVMTGWLDAVRDGVAEEMRRDPHILYFGEGTGERGGSFAHTKGLWHEFGPNRMVDTPISEQGFTAAAIGASATGARTIADLMFADFMFEAAGQIILQAARLRYMSNGQMSAPLVVRAGAGAVRSAGPHHSGAYHPIWAHVPGLVVAVPSNPADAKGLMKTALRACDPVIMLESKALFASKGEVPEGEHLVPFGVAGLARQGRDLTIVSAGQLLIRSLEAAETLAGEGIECEVIDLRTIMPLDVNTVAASVRKTHRLLIVDEGYAMCGVGAELAQAMNELAFDELDAPVGRLHTEAVPHPLAPALERAMVIDARKIAAAAKNVIAGVPPVPRHWRNAASIAPALPASVSVAPVLETPRRIEALDGEPIIMPFGDLTVSEGKILRWAKSVGDKVERGELVAEIETDKAVIEIEAPVAGVLTRILEPAGAVVPMGGQIGLVRKDRFAPVIPAQAPEG